MGSKSKDIMPCYGCNGTGVIITAGGKKRKCTSCNGKGGWPKK